MRSLLRLKKGMLLHISFVSLLTFGVLVFAVYNQSVQPPNLIINSDSVTIQVLDVQWNSSIFKYVHSVKNDGELWLLESTEMYQPGHDYQLLGSITFEYFSLDNSSFTESSHAVSSNNTNYISYRLSQGYRGQIQAKDVYAVGSTCTSSCLFVKSKYSLINQFKTTIQNKACYQWKSIIEYLYTVGPCSDISVFLTGLVIRDSTKVSDNLSTLMKSSGLSHIISVSGFQVTTLGLILELFIQKLYIGRRRGYFVIVPLLLLYAVIAGFNPPVIRAFLSTSISFGVLTFIGRRILPFYALLYSSLIILSIFPHFLVSYSFLLSFTASFSLLFLPRLELRNPYISVVFTAITSTIFAFLFTFPIVSQFENSINPLLVIAGSLMLPIIPFITVFVLLSVIPWIGEIFSLIASGMLSVCLTLLNELNHLFNSFLFRPSSILETIAYYSLLFLLIFLWRAKTQLPSRINSEYNFDLGNLVARN